MRYLFGVSAALATLLAITLPAPLRAQGAVAQLEIGDSLSLQVDQAERLTTYLTARTGSGRLIRDPAVSFLSLDTSVVEVRGDTAVAKQPGTAAVVVSAVRSRKPVEDTLTITVEGAAQNSSAAWAPDTLGPAPLGTTPLGTAPPDTASLDTAPPDTASLHSQPADEEPVRQEVVGELPAEAPATHAPVTKAPAIEKATGQGPASEKRANEATVSDTAPVAARPDSLPAGTVLVAEPNPVQLLLHETKLVVAEARREDDNSVVGPIRVTWQTLSPTVVRVDSAGLVTAVSVGTGAVQATAADGPPRTVTVTVETAPLSFAQDRLTLTIGNRRRLDVIVPAQGGRRLENSALDWRSTNERVAVVGAAGTVTARGAGKAGIIVTGFLRADTLPVVVHPRVETVSYSPASNGAPVTVPLNGIRQFTVTLHGANSQPVKGVPMTWTVADSTVARFDTLSFALAGKRVGSTRLALGMEGFEEMRWMIQVVPARITLNPSRIALSRGKRQLLAASMLDQRGKVVAPLEAATWRTSDSTVAAVGASGEVQARGLGRSLVSVTGPGGKSDTAEVFVVADLLVASSRAGQRLGIYQIDLAEPDRFVPLLVDAASNLGAVYSPDRTRIAFASLRDSSLGLYVMDAAGQQPPRRVVHALGSETALAWMPDGRRLVFTVPGKRLTTIGLLDLDSSSWDTLGMVAGNPSPDVSANGTIAYAAGEKNHADLFTIGPRGGPPVRVTNTPGEKLSPRWLPNGDLLFLAEGKTKNERFQLVRQDLKTGVQTTLAVSERPIFAVAVSRDGATMAYVTKGPDKRSPHALFVQRTAPGSTPREVKLQPGEQIAALAF